MSDFLPKGFSMTLRVFGASLLVSAAAMWVPVRPLAAQSFSQGNPGVDRYLRLDDGLYELNADGTYHKAKASSAASAPPPSTSQPRPATSPSSGRYTGQEQFMRFDDGLYERMADGTYTKVDERRQMQQQSQSGRYGVSSTSMDLGWQQQYGTQEQWNNNRPQQWSNNPSQQWNNNRPQQWSNNNQPQQWSNNRPQQWSNNNRPQQWNNNRPQPGPLAVDSMLTGNTGQDRIHRAPAPKRRPAAVDSMLNDGTGQGVSARAEGDPWYELGRSIRGVIEAESRGGRP
jgi:hypothetical protein